jgi:3-isopropylmalate/(R)-2-methylmalate dehydratase small subunit
MQPFTKLSAIAAPLDAVNADTDQIIPKQFLKRIERTGFGQFLFFDWRYFDDGVTPNPEFELNKPQWKGAEILITSREHAPWALLDYGFRALVGSSFADIFYNNCFKNGILPVKLSEATVEKLLQRAKDNPGYRMTVDLESQTVSDELGFSEKFDVDPFRRHLLLNGLDDIAMTLQNEAEISRYESTRPAWKRGAAIPG